MRLLLLDWATTDWTPPGAWVVHLAVATAVLPASQLGLGWASARKDRPVGVAVGIACAIGRWAAAWGLLAAMTLPELLTMVAILGGGIGGIFALLLPIGAFTVEPGHRMRAKAPVLVFIAVVLPTWLCGGMPGVTFGEVLRDQAALRAAPAPELRAADTSPHGGPAFVSGATCKVGIQWETRSGTGKSRRTTEHRYAPLVEAAPDVHAFVDGYCPDDTARIAVIQDALASDTLRTKAEALGWRVAPYAVVLRIVRSDDDTARDARDLLLAQLAMYVGAALLGASFGVALRREGYPGPAILSGAEDTGDTGLP